MARCQVCHAGQKSGPGNTCLSVSIHCLFQAELAKVNHQCRVTLFLDLSTFYETISHQRLEQTAYELEYPATFLNIAVQIYRRVTADSGHSPATYSSRELPWLHSPAWHAFSPLRTEEGLCHGLCFGRLPPLHLLPTIGQRSPATLLAFGLGFGFDFGLGRDQPQRLWGPTESSSGQWLG